MAHDIEAERPREAVGCLYVHLRREGLVTSQNCM